MARPKFRSLPIAMLLLVASCAGDPDVARRLAPRAAERVDPRIPIPSVETVGAVTPALSTKLTSLVAAAEAGVPAFKNAADAATSASSLAGPAQSESWIAAQQKLSAAVAARAPVTRALGDIDAAGAEALVARGGLSAADRRAIDQAAQAVGSIDRYQAAVVEAIAARLRR